MVRRNIHLDFVRSYVPCRNGVRSILTPVERFLTIEAASGIVLMVAAFIALVWANSPWRTAYADLWRIPIRFNFGPFGFERHLGFWISDGLMTVFFFVVGLEIRREIYSGELSDRHRAGLPLVAAIGGMLLPALIFFALNLGRVSQVGWAIPVHGEFLNWPIFWVECDFYKNVTKAGLKAKKSQFRNMGPSAPNRSRLRSN